MARKGARKGARKACLLVASWRLWLKVNFQPWILRMPLTQMPICVSISPKRRGLSVLMRKIWMACRRGASSHLWNQEHATLYCIIERIQRFACLWLPVWLLLLRSWDTKNMMTSCIKVFPHPCFVYAAQYHPGSPRLVVTGGYDRLIRVWTNRSEGLNGQVSAE